VPPTGSVGATKAADAGLGRGEILLELDHDDELMPEAIELVVAAFTAHADVDFVYSDCLDWLDDQQTFALYPEGWGMGFGAYATEVIDGRRVAVTLCPPITWETMRHIVSTPNHLRAWRSPFYRRIGGHDWRLGVGDDYELVVRTFLHGTMARIPRPLYVQHHNTSGTQTSRRRNDEIQRVVAEQSERYREALDRRCLSLGVPPWPDGNPWTAWEPLSLANVTIDPVAEAAADVGRPLVSVIVPTYDRSDSLRRAIESVLGQTYDHLELLVVGDGCPVVDAVIGDFDDPRVRHWNLGQRHDDSGTSPRNYALRAMARGSLIAYLDDDNVWDRHHLESLVDLYAKDPEISLAFSSLKIDGEDVICRTPRRYQIDTSALLHRRVLTDLLGGWKAPTLVGYAHDWELVSRWHGEPWAASLQATVHYDNRQRADIIDVIRAVAREEEERAS
jgi:glycosyltransferase involved in cell wall biosynthesis